MNFFPILCQAGHVGNLSFGLVTSRAATQYSFLYSYGQVYSTYYIVNPSSYYWTHSYTYNASRVRIVRKLTFLSVTYVPRAKALGNK